MKYISIFFWLCLFCLLFAYLQITNAYHFFYIEQNQLLQLTLHYTADRISQPGGFSLLLSEHLVQFFILPYAGAAINAGLLTLTGVLVYGIVKRIAPRSNLIILYLLPVLSLLLIQYDFNYKLQGTVAYILMLLFLYMSWGIKSFKSRLVYHIVSVFILFWLAGSVFILYTVAASICEFFKKSFYSYLILVVCLMAALLGIAGVYFAYYGEYRYVFLPDGYYHPNLKPTVVIYYSWICLPLILQIAYGVRNRVEIVNKKRLWAETILQTVVLLLIAWWGVSTYNDAKSIKAKELDYYSRTRQWDKILAATKGPLDNYLYISYANMALAQKGELADKVFSYDQHGVEGLLINWDKSAQLSNLLSDVYFTIGHIASSQEKAFEAYLSTMGEGNPRNLKRLIQTNLIYGEYAVAEKYISILENTFYYKKWAKEHRKYLYNDNIIESDQLLGAKRRCLYPSGDMALVNGIIKDLLQQAQQNPSETNSIEFAGILCLLSKDLKSFERIIETYYKTDVLSALPLSFQEAIIILYEKEPEKWKHFQIAPPIIERFSTYRKTIIANRNNRAALPNLLRNSFGSTYWYYYTFK